MKSLFQVLKVLPSLKEDPVSEVSIFDKEIGSSSQVSLRYGSALGFQGLIPNQSYGRKEGVKDVIGSN